MKAQMELDTTAKRRLDPQSSKSPPTISPKIGANEDRGLAAGVAAGPSISFQTQDEMRHA